MAKKTVTADTTPTTPVAAPVIIKVTDKVAKLGGTRKAWYDAIRAYDGRPLADFLASELPPLPPKGSQKGRIRFLVREGFVVLA